MGLASTEHLENHLTNQAAKSFIPKYQKPIKYSSEGRLQNTLNYNKITKYYYDSKTNLGNSNALFLAIIFF